MPYLVCPSYGLPIVRFATIAKPVADERCSSVGEPAASDHTHGVNSAGIMGTHGLTAAFVRRVSSHATQDDEVTPALYQKRGQFAIF